MKALSAILALVVVVLIAALLFEHQRAGELQTSVTNLARDRETTQRELRQLSERVATVQKRSEASKTASPEIRAAAPITTAATPAPEVPAPVERPGVTIQAPEGWHKNGAKPDSYVVGVDSTQTWGGMPSAYVQSLTPEVEKGFGGMMQTTAADNYVGKRVRLSGWIKTEDANQGGGHLWLRVDGQEQGHVLQFDNMDNRAVKGTSDWQEASVVLDVPSGASALAYGFFVSGGGKMWVSGQRMEEVGPDVATTNMIKPKNLPQAPRNLGFK